MRITKGNIKRATRYLKELLELSYLHHKTQQQGCRQISYLFSDGEVLCVKFIAEIKTMQIMKYNKLFGGNQPERITCLDELEVYIMCRNGVLDSF